MKQQMTFNERMKGYENISKNYLMRRTPVVLRIDGKSFSKYTKNLVKPFDEVLSNSMANTTKFLCENIQGAIFGYTQSDEISILLQDWKNLNTDCWFGYNTQKMCSVSASMTTAFFNRDFVHTEQDAMAFFDARAFNIPEKEVINYFIWRGSDCSRNSVSMLAQHYFSHNQLHGKNVSQMQDMLMAEHNVNWNDLETRYKRGICVYKENGKFVVDLECPLFTKVGLSQKL